MFKVIKERLQAKVMLALFISVGITMLVIFLLAINRETKHSLNELQRLIGDLGTSIYATFKYPMESGDEKIVNEFLEATAKMSKVDIIICDTNQRVVYATKASLKNAKVSELVHNKDALIALNQGLKDGLAIEKLFEEKVGNEHYASMIKLMKNEASCYHCHGRSKSVLGAIIVKKPITESYNAIASSRNQNLIIGTVGSLFIMGLLYFLINHIIIKPIEVLTEKAELIAEGNMTVEVPVNSEDEIGKLSVSFNRMAKRLKELLQQVASASEQINLASSEVAASSQKLAEGASESASSLEETSASLEEIASMAKQNADNALQTDQLMKQTEQIVNETETSMKKLTESMESMAKMAEEVQKIVKSIDEIAFQTNLLALNAAVEAARAGEAGQGFAVVADEVRNLAQRTASAAKDTAQLIEQTVKGIQDNLALVKKVDVDFDKVEESAKKVASLVAEISAASQEQSQGIGQLNTALSQMDKTTQQVAANAEELASASEEMKSQVANLIELLKQFKFDEKIIKTPKMPQERGKDLAKTKSTSEKIEPEKVIPLDENLEEF